MIASVFGQPLEVRQLPFGHEPIRDLRILTVEPDDDQSLDPRLGQTRATEKAQSRSEGPQQEGEERDDSRDEEDQEGRHEDESGSGPHVRRHRLGANQEQNRGARSRRQPCETGPAPTIMAGRRTPTACTELVMAISILQKGLRRVRYGEPIIVVSGLPRTGTSMMMQMLDAGGIDLVTDGLRAADESNPLGYMEYERVKDLEDAEDKAWLHDARGRAVKVIAFLLEHLPATYNYKVVFMNTRSSSPSRRCSPGWESPMRPTTHG